QVAGHEDESPLERFAPALESGIEFRPAELGHFDIADDHIKFLLIDQIEGHASVRRRLDGISGRLDHILEQLADFRFIFNYQDLFACCRKSPGSRFGHGLRRPTLDGKFDYKRRSASNRAFNVDAAAVLADHRLADAQTKSGAFSNWLG